MKKANAWKQALQESKGRWGDLMAAALVKIALRCLALCPLAALLAPKGSFLRYLAILCPVLMIFGIWPLRFSAAEAQAEFLAGGKFCTGKLVSFSRYSEKLKLALGHGLIALAWALPLIAALGYILYTFKGGNGLDALTVLRILNKAGALVGGNFIQGVILLVAAVVALSLPLFYGLCRMSAARHLWARGASSDCLKGARWRQLGLGVVNSLMLLPIFVTLGLILKDVVSVFMKSFSLPPMINYVYILAAVVLVTYLPLMPLRRLSVACFARTCAQDQDQTHAA